MKYMGSKARIAKYLVPIIQSYIDELGDKCHGYLEPFCGGCNVIDKISCKNKYANDNNKYLIALLEQAQQNTSVFPETISEETYYDVKLHPERYADWFVGLVGFCSFGARFFQGYPRGFKNDGVTPRDMPHEFISNLIKQAPYLSGIQFKCCDFQQLNPHLKNWVIYCDPPYKGVKQYDSKPFPYDKYYDWCRLIGQNNTVLCSEYWMPDDFKCIWEMPVKSMLNQTTPVDTVERLFIYNGTHLGA